MRRRKSWRKASSRKLADRGNDIQTADAPGRDSDRRKGHQQPQAKSHDHTAWFDPVVKLETTDIGDTFHPGCDDSNRCQPNYDAE
jgi:hypothetical protein